MAETRWALLKSQDIRDFANPEETYLWRFRFITTPWFGVMFHKIKLPDSDRGLHDHPWNFFSIILKGGYLEETEDGGSILYPGSVNAKRAEGRHRIVKHFDDETWSLVFHGRLRRNWGFVVNDVWVDHDTYLNGRSHV